MDASAPLTCQQIADAYEDAITEVDASCETVADCVAPGGPIEDTCNCTPALPEHAVNRAAYDASIAKSYVEEFVFWCADSADAPAVCDAAPSDLDCIDNRCVLSLNSCL